MLILMKNILAEFYQKLAHSRENIQREAEFWSMPNKIKVAIGMRRVGKTEFLLQEIRKLQLESNIALEQILFINFEDDRLLPCSQEKLVHLLDAFYQVYPENHHRQCYVFLDEIQNVDNWALVLRRFFDSKKITLYLSGSSAKLLSKEVATSLRGRALSSEIWPYSFQEYLRAKSITWTESNLFAQAEYDMFKQLLITYIEEGGFPEVVNVNQVERCRVLQDYVELVVMRDIVERHRISNIALIKYLIKTLLKSPGCMFSINKFVNDLKSQGIDSSRNTLHDYMNYVEDAFLAFTVPLFSESLKKIQSNPKKVYVVDSGLAKAYSFSMNENYGHLFENLVYLDLRRAGHEIFYYLTRERYEVDFLTRSPTGKLKLYQVVWDTSDSQTLEREIRALDAAKAELNIDGEIITPQVYLNNAWARDNNLGSSGV